MTTPPPGDPLYTARPAIWMRILSLSLAAGVVLMLGAGGAMSLIVAPRPNVILAGLLVALLGAVLVIVALGNRHRFVVGTTGLLIRGSVTTHRIPWGDVRRIEVDQGFLHRGETVVLRHDGSRVRSAVTGARYAIRRGESTSDHGPSLRGPARPTRAAIHAHRRYLGGRL